MRFKILIFIFIPFYVTAQSDENVFNSYSDQSIELRMAMLQTSTTGMPMTASCLATESYKKPGLGLVMSAALPGTGEMYAGSWVKGFLLLGTEVALWIGYKHYRSEGDQLDKEYRAFADAHWSEQRYWVSMAEEASQEAGWEHLSDVTENNYKDYLYTDNGLRDYEKIVGSHSLHVVKDQQYYEMIGKYHQFRKGWDDWDDSETSFTVETPNNAHYEKMEQNTDSHYKTAGLCGMIILANHVLSSLDAVWSVKQFNHRIQFAPKVGLMRTRESISPTICLGFAW